jgi:hypothetical protein
MKKWHRRIMSSGKEDSHTQFLTVPDDRKMGKAPGGNPWRGIWRWEQPLPLKLSQKR